MTRECDSRARQFTHDWDVDDGISVTVINAVAEVTGRDVDRLTPLRDVVNPEALDEAVRPAAPVDRQYEGPLSISFEYEGFEITVRRSGQIVLYPSSAPSVSNPNSDE